LFLKLNVFIREIALGVSLVFLMKASAQQLPVTSISLEEDLRYLQVLGQLSKDVSLTVRPIMPEKHFFSDSFYYRIDQKKASQLKGTRLTFLKRAASFSLLPMQIVGKWASHHPYGWSDGALMPAAGMQTLVSTGFYFRLGPLTIQARPEWLYAANPSYKGSASFGATLSNPNYQRIFAGQSKIELGAGPVALALSSENLSWGPGQFSGLMMTNNAPGFNHLRFYSRRPLRTLIGNFEWQVVGGRLEDESAQPDEIYHLRNYGSVNGWSKPYWKYLNSFVITYQPSFLKGIYLGATRSFTSSGTNVSESLVEKEGVFRAYLPIFADFFKSRLVNEDQRQWNQLVSVYMRYLFQRSNAEAYFEYGWNDHKYNLRDLMMSPFHSAAYLAGYKKLFRLSKGRWLDLSGEIVQTEQSPDFLVRSAGNWYVHTPSSNYSHYGQVLGSGIGFGANAQIGSALIRKGFDYWGVVIERVQRDPNVFAQRWTDLGLGLRFRKSVGSFFVQGKCMGVGSKNYAWVQDQRQFNFIANLSVNYQW